MNSTNKSTTTFSFQHIAVVLVGLLVFVLLVFADKTNLNDDSAESISNNASGNSTEVPEQSGNSLLDLVPPGNPSEELSVLLTAFDQSGSDSEQEEVLPQIVNGFRDDGRLDLAAVYAGMLADRVPKLNNLLVAGALFRNANKLPTLQADSSAFVRFSQEAIRHLETAVELDSSSEDAQIELGLAFVESRTPGLSMQGIFKIKGVAEANPQNTEALFHLGGFSMDTGQYDKAEKRFRQVLEVQGSNPKAKYYLGLALQAQGETAEFRKWMTEVAEQVEEPELAAAAKSALNNN